MSDAVNGEHGRRADIDAGARYAGNAPKMKMNGGGVVRRLHSERRSLSINLLTRVSLLSHTQEDAGDAKPMAGRCRQADDALMGKGRLA